jgi:RNA polymerase sigma-70 factor (ECF subfamily)
MVQQARVGSSHAFAALYAQYQKQLYAYACICLRNAALAEDAVQEAALIAYRRMDDLRQENSFEPWLFKILANECRRIGRAERLSVPLGERPVADAAPDNIPLSDELRDALYSLPWLEREIVMLCVVTGLSGREAAHALRMNHATLRSKRARALCKLRVYLGDMDENI